MPTATTYSITIYKRSRSPFWWARWYIPGGNGADKRWSTGVRVDGRESKRVAEVAAKEQAAEFAHDVEKPQAPADAKASLKAVVKRMLEQKIADGRRDKTVENLSWIIGKNIFGFFGETRDVRTIRRADVEAFKAHLRSEHAAAQSINNLLTAMRQILKHACHVDELIEAVPEVKNVASDKHPKWRILTPQELDALLSGLDPRAREAKHYLLFVANTGLRKSEALATRYSWIDWEARTMHIPAPFTKGGRGRPPVHLNDVVIALLKDRLRSPPKRQADPDRIFLQQKHDQARNSAAERANLGRVRTHDLRHTLGSLAHASGASLPEVRDMLGHKTLAMVNHYAHSYESRLREIAGKLKLGKKHAPRVSSAPNSVPGERHTSGRKGSKRKPKADGRRRESR